LNDDKFKKSANTKNYWFLGSDEYFGLIKGTKIVATDTFRERRGSMVGSKRKTGKERGGKRKARENKRNGRKGNKMLSYRRETALQGAI